MANSENTPAKAYGNFLDMIHQAEAMDGYNPSNENLLVPSMKTLHADGTAALDLYQSSKAIMLAGKKERVRTVEVVKDISRRVVNLLKASGADAKKIEQAMTIHRLIHGYKAPGAGKVVEAAEAPTEDEAKKRANKQGSQDSLVQNFQQLIHVIKMEPLYKPNEADLKVASLEALVNKFKTDDAAVAAASAVWEKSKAKLAKLYNGIPKGAKAVMTALKLYVKAAFGANSREYKAIARIAVPVLRF
jgi:hypothetical protein